MAKYSFELKKKIVLEYLNEEVGYKTLAKKYGIPAIKSIKTWVYNYNAFGDKGFFRSRKNEGRLQVQIEQDLSSNYISGIHLIKKSVEQFIRSVVA